MRDVLAGLAYLHARSIIHRDIKPQNIFLQGSKPKIGDFGFAVNTESSLKDKFTVGSPLYMSPQMLLEKVHSFKNDIWALGVTMYEVFEGKAPWMVSSR